MEKTGRGEKIINSSVLIIFPPWGAALAGVGSFFLLKESGSSCNEVSLKIDLLNF